MNKIDVLAKTLWNYNKLNQDIIPADCVVALGNSDIRTAQKAAQLYNNGFGNYLVTTGGYGRLTKYEFKKPEAQIFADEAISLGVPKEKIIIEDKSSNTFDNLRFTLQQLNKNNIKADSIILVTKPYMERRALAMASKIWTGKNINITSPDLSYENYPNKQISKTLLINMLVGDTQRIIKYGEAGDLVEQIVPDEVIFAMEELIKQGYSQQLINFDIPRE